MTRNAFLDYKMGCVLAMLNCLREYDPAQGADFLTYAHHFIGNALLTCRMQEETGSFENVDEYKAVRGNCMALQSIRSV